MKLLSPHAKYKWRLFWFFRRTCGWREAFRFMFGNYYIMPCDHEPTAYEIAESEFLRAYRKEFPSDFHPFISVPGGRQLAMTPAVRKHITEAVWGSRQIALEDAAQDTGYVGSNIPCGLGYTYPEEDDAIDQKHV